MFQVAIQVDYPQQYYCNAARNTRASAALVSWFW